MSKLHCCLMYLRCSALGWTNGKLHLPWCVESAKHSSHHPVDVAVPAHSCTLMNMLFPCCAGCGYGYLWPDQGLGWDIVALPDTHPDYAGSCGRCYEVKCKGGSIKDGYGQNINRDGVCKDEGASVIVRTTDTCPCNFPANYYSNKRWCCGDEVGHRC